MTNRNPALVALQISNNSDHVNAARQRRHFSGVDFRHETQPGIQPHCRLIIRQYEQRTFAHTKRSRTLNCQLTDEALPQSPAAKPGRDDQAGKVAALGPPVVLAESQNCTGRVSQYERWDPAELGILNKRIRGKGIAKTGATPHKAGGLIRKPVHQFADMRLSRVDQLALDGLGLTAEYSMGTTQSGTTRSGVMMRNPMAA